MCHLSVTALPNRRRRLLWRLRYSAVADGRRERRLVGGLIVTLGLVLLITVACGGNGANETGTPTERSQVSLEEYFHELSVAFGRLEQAVAGSAEPVDPGLVDTPQEFLDYLHDSLVGLEQAISVFIGEVEALGPPSEAASAHKQFLEGLRGDRQSIAELAVAVREADSIEDATAVFEARAGLIAESREPCRRLEEVAREHNITVDLPCEQ